MRNRTLALLLGATLVFGGFAACGDDDDDDDGGTDTTESDGGDEGGDEGDGGDESGNADVQAYCDAVAEYVEEAQAALDDPANADTAALTARGQELGTQAADLAGAGLSQEELEEVNACSQEAAEALTP